jgi:diguanylate cyclase (GGDEF)-like protein
LTTPSSPSSFEPHGLPGAVLPDSPNTTALLALQAENLLLRSRLVEATQQLGRWQAAQQDAEKRALELLRASSLSMLLEKLMHGLKRACRLQAVRLILQDPQHELQQLLASDGVQLGGLEGVVLVDTLLPLSAALGSLEEGGWAGPYRPAEHAALVPPGQAASLCLTALHRGIELAGVLVFASSDPEAFGARAAGEALVHLGRVAALCTQNALGRARLLRSSLTDFLTGFHNRRYLQARLHEELARSQRAGQSLVCLMIDIDHFKRINDEHGHLAGDEVLREVARRIETEMRRSDTGARFGGDEFTILLSESTLADGVRVAARVRDAVRAQPVRVGDRAAHVTVSIGLAGAAAVSPQQKAASAGPPLPGTQTAHDQSLLSERLLAAADEALYKAKSAGRDRVVICTALVT